MPCDTLLAIRSLQSNSQTPSCLEIPLPDGTAIRGVLECQLHEFFMNNKRGAAGGSSHVVSRELDQLMGSNTLRRLCSSSSATIHRVDDNPVALYVLTRDYERAVRASVAAAPAADGEEKSDGACCIVDWFLHNLKHWTGARIAQSSLQEAWRRRQRQQQNCDGSGRLPSNRAMSSDAVVRWLQDRQLLHAVASADHSQYQLWLPAWGRHVLPALSRAGADAMSFLRQSQRGERSVVSLVQRLRRHPVPAGPVVIPWLVERGLVRRVERPAGNFLRLRNG